VNDNKRLATDCITDLFSNGVGCIQKYTLPGFVWWVAGMGEIQGKLGDVDAVMKKYQIGPTELRIVGVTAEGDRVALETEGRATLRNGSLYANQAHWLFEFRNGKIVRIREYHDTKHVSDVWGRVLND
jgi:uncharacterized protein